MEPMPKDMQSMRIVRVEQVFTLVAVCEVEPMDEGPTDIQEREYIINSYRRAVPSPYSETP